MRGNGCAILVLIAPIALLIWMIVNWIPTLFAGVAVTTLANSHGEFKVGDPVAWGIDYHRDDISDSLRQYAQESGGFITFNGVITSTNGDKPYYTIHVTEEESARNTMAWSRGDKSSGPGQVSYIMYWPKDEFTPMHYRGSYPIWAYIKAIFAAILVLFLVLCAIAIIAAAFSG